MTDAGQGWFAASDAVGRYWLARCNGFEVLSEEGRLSGVVRDVGHDDTGHASTLVVERQRGGALEVSAGSATWIDPWQRLVVVTVPPRRPRTAPARTAARAASRTASRGGNVAWTGAATVGAASLGVAATARRAGPPAGRFALWLGARMAYGLAFAGWLYGAIVYAGSRVATRLLLILLRAMARVGFWALPPLVRSVHAGAARGLSHLTADVHGPDSSPPHSPRARAPVPAPRKPRRGSLYW